MKSCKNLKGGLQEVADALDVTRIGPQHQVSQASSPPNPTQPLTRGAIL